jgi:hypothetical protein
MLFCSCCWDHHELNELFYYTGIALDAAADPDEIDFALELKTPKRRRMQLGETGLRKTARSSLKLNAKPLKNNRRDELTAPCRIFIQHNRCLWTASARRTRQTRTTTIFRAEP